MIDHHELIQLFPILDDAKSFNSDHDPSACIHRIRPKCISIFDESFVLKNS